MDEKLPENFLAYNEFFMKLGSMWPLAKRTSPLIYKVLNVLFCLFMLFCVGHVVFTVGFYIYLCRNSVGIDILFERISLYQGYVLATIQFAYVQCQPMQLVKMVKFLNANFRFVSTDGFETISVMDSYRLSRNLTISISLMYLASRYFSIKYSRNKKNTNSKSCKNSEETINRS